MPPTLSRAPFALEPAGAPFKPQGCLDVQSPQRWRAWHLIRPYTPWTPGRQPAIINGCFGVGRSPLSCYVGAAVGAGAYTPPRRLFAPEEVNMTTATKAVTVGRDVLIDTVATSDEAA